MAEPHSYPKALLVNPSSKNLKRPRNLNPTLEFLALNNKPHYSFPKTQYINNKKQLKKITTQQNPQIPRILNKTARRSKTPQIPGNFAANPR